MCASLLDVCAYPPFCFDWAGQTHYRTTCGDLLWFLYLATSQWLQPNGATCVHHILRLRWFRLITSSSVRSGWSCRLNLRTWNLLRVGMMVRGHIAICSGLRDLLLDSLLNSYPFHYRFQSWSWLSWREHHSLQQSFDGVDSLIGLFHHSLKLCLSTCHLGRVNLSVLSFLLVSRPLGRI